MDLWKLAILSYMFAANAANGGNITEEDDITTTSDVITTPFHETRRRQQPRSIVGGGRYSLMNSRFNRRSKPRKKNLDRDQLMDILGDYFDPEWMSIEEPSAMSKTNRGSTLVFRRDGWQHVELVEQLRLSNLTTELYQILRDNETGSDVKRHAEVERYLLKRATCPVRYFWDDIGANFWPRYIRRGNCPLVPGTCSWPPGMHCVPSGTSSLHLLRWQCKSAPKSKKSKSVKHQRRDWTRGGGDLRCHWIRVPYPITSNCMCMC